MFKLESLVELRQKEAVEKDLGEKTFKVSTMFGKKKYSFGLHDSTVYSEGDFEASYKRGYFGWVSIKYNGKQVFLQEFQSVGGSFDRLKDRLLVRAYIPGEWEDKLNQAYERTLKLEDRRNVKAYAPRREYLKEAFEL